ncbi:collagen alpha-1(XII) chain-like, partial [Thunnus maccoyii]|uniref:collagen alpha-1(XII) chain-like n=1 Tax=Thunnus maccoyii TaxID=8240 RepID=UPI001C4C2FDA
MSSLLSVSSRASRCPETALCLFSSQLCSNLNVKFLIFSPGLQAEDKHQSTGSQCESTAKADIMLLVDGSYSIGLTNFAIIRSFLNQTVSNFDIGPDKVQIGLVQYSDDPNTEWQLNTHQTKKSLMRAIANLPYKGGNTYTGEALKHILHNNFKPNVGMRADSHKIAILITDGKSQDNVSLASQHLRDTGIEVYAIGVKSANEDELRVIASDPIKNHVYTLSDFSSLLDIVDNLTINLCNSTNSSLDSVRLVNGTTMCSGRLEVKFNQFNQSWSSVCEADFDQQDAEVVCRELGCGAP